MLLSFASLVQKTHAITKTLHYLFSHVYNPQTVYALSSGVQSAISIVRISGSESYKVLNLLKHQYDCNSPKELLLSNLKVKPRTMMLRSLYSKEKGLIDKCLMVYFEASNSYSGEDLFQLHLHGSKAIVSAVFQQLSRLRFKPAKRGQFTRRALLNGRMSLLEAEAINDLIHSQLQFQRQIAMSNLMGKGAKYLQSLRKDLTVVKCLIQSYIQFEEQEVGKGLYQNAKEKSRIILKSLRQVLQSSKKLQNAKEGIKFSIVGRPNVGKSTLINKLVKKDVAIVSNIPGTTRDLIESSFQLKGYRVEVVDTAGIRDSSCQIQKQGIRRSKKSMQESHFSIIVLDVSQSILKETEDKLILLPNEDELKMLNIEDKLVIINKIDTLPPSHKNKQLAIEWKDGSLLIPSLAISANTEEGALQLTQYLSNLIEQKFNLYSNNGSQIYFTRDRYIKSLEECALHLQNMLQQQYADLGGHFIDSAIRSVEEIIGKIDSEQILDQIFSTFCIGK